MSYKLLNNTHTATASSSGRSCQSPHACAVSMGGARPCMLMCSEQPSPRPGVNSNRMSFNSFLEFLWDPQRERERKKAKRQTSGHLSICPRDSQERQQSGTKTINLKAKHFMFWQYFQTIDIPINLSQFHFLYWNVFKNVYIISYANEALSN